MKITVIGTGYVGLVTGACLSKAGHSVVCMDIDDDKIQRLRRGELPIYEPGLAEIVVDNSQLTFTTSLSDAVAGAEVIFLALPTPPNDDGSADITRTLAVAPKIAELLTRYAVIVNKSTVPVGTTLAIHKAMADHTTVAFDVVSNPEFLREGQAVQDFANPVSIVVGTSSPQAREVMSRVYQAYADKGADIVFMDEYSAEITKYAMNTMLANKISMINELANVCDRVGANIDDVRQVVGADPRIGNLFLNPGIGYGGSCFPKDVRALLATANQHGYDMPIAKAVVQTNLAQRRILVDKITQVMGTNLHGKSFAVWGLAFKPHTDDLRESPALVIIDELLGMGAAIRAFDPVANGNARQLYVDQPLVTVLDTKDTVLQHSDALIIATDWPEFGEPDFVAIKQALNQPIIFDGRNMFNPQQLQDLGFRYYSIGRGDQLPGVRSRD